MSAMLGVIETSLQGSSMRVLQSEDADPWTGPNIVFVTQPAAERPSPEGSPESRRSRSVATFATVQRRRGLTWRFEAKLRCSPGSDRLDERPEPEPARSRRQAHGAAAGRTRV